MSHVFSIHLPVFCVHPPKKIFPSDWSDVSSLGRGSRLTWKDSGYEDGSELDLGLSTFLTLGCQGCDCETVVSPCWVIQVVKKTSTGMAVFSSCQKISKQTAHCDMEENHMACLHECVERAPLLSAEPGFAFLLKEKK